MKHQDHILLVFPPAFYPHMPYLALPTISAALRQFGLGHSMTDLNVELYDWLLRPATVAASWDKVRALKQRSGHPAELWKRLELTGHPDMGEIIGLIPDALAAVRGQPNKLDDDLDPWKILTLGLDIVSDAHYPEEITFNTYNPGCDVRSSQRIAEHLPQRRRSLYHDACMEMLRRDIDLNDPDVIAFSITAPEQIVPTAGLCATIREELPDIRIIWGGSIPTRLGDVLAHENPLMSLYDAVVLGEGDQVIAEAVAGMRSDRTGADSKPLVFRSSDAGPSIDNLAAPNFEGLPHHLYFDRQLTLPLLTSRRCYWSKCRFCDIPASYGAKHRTRMPSQVVDDMQTMVFRNGTSFVKFVDDAVSPQMLKGISEEILRRGLDVQWEAYVRLERQFADATFCRLLHAAGCRWLYFGLETGSEDTLRKMNKGVNPELTTRIIEAVADSGMKVHVWIIVGFPSETRDDVQKTVDFLMEHRRLISSVEVNQFALTRLSPIMRASPSPQPGISPAMERQGDLTLIYDYTVESGLTQSEARDLTLHIRGQLREQLGIPDVVRSSHLASENTEQLVAASSLIQQHT